MKQVIQKTIRLFKQDLKYWVVQTIAGEVLTALFLLLLGMTEVEVPSFSQTLFAFVLFDFIMIVSILISNAIVTIIGNKTSKKE